MRLNKYIAVCTGLSRRQADDSIVSGKVKVNGQIATLGQRIINTDLITLEDKELIKPEIVTIALNKPVGYVVSRNGQGSKTIYDLIPDKFHSLKPVGRLDKDSSGLILLTNDGELAERLTHPSNDKEKVYIIELDRKLSNSDYIKINSGIILEDGKSNLKITGKDKVWEVKMSEGRNRQIRRTFEKAGYKVTKLHRIKFGEFELENLPIAGIKTI